MNVPYRLTLLIKCQERSLQQSRRPGPRGFCGSSLPSRHLPIDSHYLLSPSVSPAPPPRLADDVGIHIGGGEYTCPAGIGASSHSPLPLLFRVHHYCHSVHDSVTFLLRPEACSLRLAARLSKPANTGNTAADVNCNDTDVAGDQRTRQVVVSRTSAIRMVRLPSSTVLRVSWVFAFPSRSWCLC